jgi:CheY-like chemotaxis protein
MAKRILVVDDSEDLRDAYVFILEQAGYEVVTSADGDEGFAQARALRPDLIISDVAMPNMDGLELLEKLRSDLSPPVPPVILCSGFDMSEAEALRRGALMFLRKPFEKADILEYVAQGLSRRPVSEPVAERERRHAEAVRRSTREIAALFVDELQLDRQAQARALAAITKAPLEWLRGYFGCDQAELILVDASGLRLVAHAGDDIPPPSLVAAPGAFHDIVESGSTLVVSDVTRHPCFAQITTVMREARFFAGAPLTLDDGTAIGMVCVAARGQRRFAPQDLGILQTVAERGTLLVGVLAGKHSRGDIPGRFGAGVLTHEMFLRVAAFELQLLRRAGGSLAVAVVEDVDGMSWERVGDAIRRAAARERLVAGNLDARRVAICRRDLAGGALATVEQVASELMAPKRSGCAVGLVELAGSSIPGFNIVDVMRMAELAVERAIDSGVRRVQLDLGGHDPEVHDERVR